MTKRFDGYRYELPGRDRIRAIALALLTASLLGGCQTTLGPQISTKTVTIDVGQNQIGEPCKVSSAPSDKKVSGQQSAYWLFCGRWEEPSAHIVRAMDMTSTTNLASRGAWRDGLDNLVNCQSPVATQILDGLSATALDCTLRIGGWPYQALVIRIGDETFLVDGIPAAYPAMERAIGILAGRLNPGETTSDTAKLSDETRRLEARLAGAKYSAGDLQQYRDLLRLAQYYNYQGNFTEAEKRYRTALEIQGKALSGDQGNLGFLYMHIALELSNQQRFNLAEALFTKAETLVPESLEPTDEPRLVSYRALHLANQRKYKQALELAHRATSMRREIASQYGYNFSSTTVQRTEFVTDVANARSNQVGEGQNLLGSRAATALGDTVQSLYVEAAMLVELGRYEDAKRILAEALQVLDTSPNIPRRWLPQIQLLQGGIAERIGNLAQAERFLLASIKTQRTLFTQSRTEGLAQIALGRVYAAEGRPVQALDAFRTGFSIIEQRGGGLRFVEVWPFFQTALAESKRDTSQQQALFAEMFRVGQTIKGTITAETIALTAARLAASDQDVGVLIRQLQDARRQRDELLEMLTAAEADTNVLAPQLTALEQQWQAQANTIADLERQVQAASPRYNQLIDTPASLEDVESVLHPGEALVQILVGTDHSMGFFVDTDGIEAYPISLTEPEANQLVAKLRAPFEAVDTLPDYPVKDAYELYQRLFGPVTGRLEIAKHVITVPSGPLLSLPFGLFVVAPPPDITDYDYTQVAWMASRQALTLAPSVQSIVNLRKTVKPSLAEQSFIGFGDFKPYGNAKALLANSGLPESCKDDVYQIANAPPLPKTAVELRTVAASLEAPQSSLYLGDSFSKANVEETKLSGYKVVYFATHGLLPHELSCYAQPALLVSKSEKANIPGDGLLTASDILGLSLDADLVVLSACNTGGPGGQTGGESLSGLARAFFYAGARSLLVTHWETPDEPTTVLMVDTFKRLGSGTYSLAEALRESQAELIQRYPYWSHPKAWASFSVVGDGAQHLTPIKLTGTDSGG